MTETLTYIDFPQRLRKGDTLVYVGKGIKDLTIGKSYSIQDFYDGKYGIIVRDDSGNLHECCMANVQECFRKQTMIADPDTPSVEFLVLKPTKISVDITDGVVTVKMKEIKSLKEISDYGNGNDA